MPKWCIIYMIILYCMGCPQFLIAQKYSKVREDFDLWYSLSASFKHSKKRSSEIKASIRTINNATSLKSQFIEYGINYSHKKNITVKQKIRLSGKSKKLVLRYSPAISPEYRIKPFDLSYRLRADISYTLGMIATDTWSMALRQRVGLYYHRKKIKYEGGLFAEWFFKNDKTPYLPNKIRWILKTKYHLSKLWSLQLRGIFQNIVNTTKPRREYIIAMGVIYRWKKNKDKP